MMNPERCRQVDELFQAALERAPEDRSVFVSEACGGDDSLRLEVEELLAADGEAGSLIEAPAYAVAAPLIVESDTPSLSGKTIGHYQIISLLGKGGMGEVYRARDNKLRREVAIKVLPAALSSDRDRLRRFEQEAIAASALNHPNILTIYEIGQDRGRHFLATELIDGITLRQWMKREPHSQGEKDRSKSAANSEDRLAEALKIVIQVVSGLASAHEAGIVHRDIKPENVMLRHDGYVKILDFGLAKLVERKNADVDMEASTIANVHTDPGAVMGTAQYMSPEQARGLDVDSRTDIFSMGVMLYEIIAGRRPFEGQTTSDVIAAILTLEPAPLIRSAPDVPPELEHIVSRALRKDRESRYQTSKELLFDLKEFERELEVSADLKSQLPSAAGCKIKHRKRVLAAGLMILVLAAVILMYLIWSSRKDSGSLAESASIVALPAQVLGAQEFSYLTDAIPSTISTYLANAEELETKAPPTSLEFDRIKGDLGKIAELYGAKNCVVSSITAVDADNSVLNVKLVECHSKRLLWSKEYEGRRGSYIEMTRQAADDILHKLKPAAAPITSATGLAANSEAELAFRQGQYFWNRYNTKHQSADFDHALEALKRALDFDHKLADAAAEIAWLYEFKFETGAPAQEMIPEMEAWANQALAINSRNSKGLAALAILENLRPAPSLRKMFEHSLRAASFGTQDAFIHNIVGAAAQGYSLKLCLPIFLESRRLDPLFLHPSVNAAMILRYLGRTSEALALDDEVLKIEPGMPAGLYEKTMALLDLGRMNEAVGLAKRLEKEARENRFPGFALMLMQYKVAAKSGNAKAAEAILGGILKTLDNPQTSRFHLEFVNSELVPYLAQQGKTVLAFQIMTRSLMSYVLPYDFLMLNPQLASLRADARFKPIEARSRTQFDEMLKVMEESRSRGEMLPYLAAPLAELLKKLETKD